MKNPNIRNILVPVDFSGMSIRAVRSAKELAGRLGANVHLAHVHDFDYPVMIAPAPAITPAVITFGPEVQKSLTARLISIANNSGLPSRAGYYHLRTGRAFNEICKLAGEIKADLIVTSTHGYTGLKHVLMGSTAERIVRHAPCPVFVARPKAARHSANSIEQSVAIGRILVPVDFSGCSLKGLNYAIDLAERFAARLIILHAVSPAYAFTKDGYAMYDLPAVTAALRKEAEHQMKQFLKSVKFGRVEFETAIKTGPASPEICLFARSCATDLIIISTHGRTGFKHLFLGSVAEQVVRSAPCAVLVVPSHLETRVSSLKPDRKPTPRTLFRRPRGQKMTKGYALTKRDRKLAMHALPERRATNKFRETHAGNLVRAVRP